MKCLNLVKKNLSLKKKKYEDLYGLKLDEIEIKRNN